LVTDGWHRLVDAAKIAGLVCFHQKRLDLLIDGEAVGHLATRWL
jgi:hypothetical protein